MREYASVSPRFWTGDTGKFLRRHPNAQRLAFYLMTCPNSNMLGLYYLPLPTIVHETGMTLEQVREGFERGLEGGFARYDEVSETVYVPEMARFQIADELKPKDNRSIAVEKALAAFVKSHKSPFVKDFVEKYAVRFHLQNVEGYRRGPEGVSDPCRSQDQDQDQDQDSFSSSASPSAGGKGSPKKPKAKKPKQAKPRPRNEVFDAVAEITGTDPVVGGSHVGKIAALLVEADPPYTPAEVREFGRRFPELCSYAAKEGRTRPFVGEVEKYIGLVRAKPLKPFAESAEIAAKRSRDALASSGVDGAPMSFSRNGGIS